MPIFNLNVKWGQQKFNVECNSDESPDVLKAQLFCLSGVQPDRQKLLGKGFAVKPDDWGKTVLTEGMSIMMLGSATELPQVPKEKTKFIEDMNDDQLANLNLIPTGLANLGNTCYLNATIQCFKCVPELCETLKSYNSSGPLKADQRITSCIRDLFSIMKPGSQSAKPYILLATLHDCFPQFATTGEGGGLQQQDANEVWISLIRCLKNEVHLTNQTENMGNGGFIEKYFCGEFNITMKCVESETEPETILTESFSQLDCFIDKEVKYLSSGLKTKMKDQLTKYSPSLKQNAIYQKEFEIKRLPAYLTIQMVRFFYKEKEQINAKILKDVKFPMSLDVHDLCSAELRSLQLPMRNRFKDYDDKMALIKSKAGNKKVEPENVKEVPYSFENDIGSNNSGFYELQAVLTHKGRSSSSGHYVAWTRYHDNEWLMFDDENVTPVMEEDIGKLSGGGDWHCAYMLLYGPRKLKVNQEVVPVITEEKSEKMIVD